MERTSFRLAPDRHLSPPPHSQERRGRRGKKQQRRCQGDRFPPAYREPHEARILAETERVQAELARLDGPHAAVPSRPCRVCGRCLVRAKNNVRCGRCRVAQLKGRAEP